MDRRSRVSHGLYDPLTGPPPSGVPTGASPMTQTRTRVMCSSARLQMIVAGRCSHWWFRGHPPHKCLQLERLQERFHEYRLVFGTAETARAVLAALYPRGRGRPAHPVSFERALRMLGHRLVRLDAILTREATGYVGPDCRVRRYQRDFDDEPL